MVTGKKNVHTYEPIPAAIVAAATFNDTPSLLRAPFVAACNLQRRIQYLSQKGNITAHLSLKNSYVPIRMPEYTNSRIMLAPNPPARLRTPSFRTICDPIAQNAFCVAPGSVSYVSLWVRYDRSHGQMEDEL